MAYNAEENQNESQNAQGTGTPGAPAGGQPLSGSGSTDPAASSRTAAFSNGQSNNQAGSGRFTNLQKYIGANQGAGDRLYSGINANIDRSTAGDKKESTTQAQNVGAAVDEAKGKLNTGNQYLNQVSNISTNSANTDPNQANNPYDIANNADTLNDFTKYRTNKVIDANSLSNQVNNAQTATEAYQNNLQGKLQQVNSENGRYQLLNNTFGGGTAYKPTYTTGQQRLDNLFLQAGGNNNIANLQNNVQNQLNTAGQSLDSLKGQAGTVNTLGTQYSDLASQLGTKTDALQQAYINDLSGRVGGVNADRDATRAGYNKFVDTATGRDRSSALNKDLLNESGLQMGQQTFNVLNNTLGARDVVNFDDRNANNYHDIANQGNVDYYGALAKLAGIDNGNLNSTGMLVDPATGQLTKAAAFKTGADSLTGRINTARDKVLADATGFRGYGADSISTGGASNTPGVGVAADQTVNGYLNNIGNNNNYLSLEGAQNDPSNRGWERLIGSQDSLVDPVAGINATNNLDAVKAMSNLRNNAYLARNPNSTGQGVDQTISNVSNTAGADVQSKLDAYLKTLGFNNYLSDYGVQEGANGIGNYGYTPGSTTKGFYNPTDDTGKF